MKKRRKNTAIMLFYSQINKNRLIRLLQVHVIYIFVKNLQTKLFQEDYKIFGNIKKGIFLRNFKDYLLAEKQI